MNKKIIALSIATLSIVGVKAQKTELTTAVLTYQEFEKAQARQDFSNMKPVLVKAKEKIDEAYTKQEENKSLKAKDIPKLYYYRGMTYLNYAGLAMFDEEIKKEVEENEASYEEIIKSSFDNCIKEDARNEYTDKIYYFADIQRSQAVNAGIEMYNKGDHEKAFMLFEASVEIYDLVGKTDSISLYYGGISASKIENKEKAIEYLTRCAESGYQGANSHAVLIGTMRGMGADEETTVAAIKKARTAYPDDYSLLIEELNYYLAAGKNEEAEANLKAAIEKNPNDHILLFTIGNVYDKQGEFEKAEENYKKAIAIKDDYVDAQYSLGALYVNHSTDLKKLASEEKEMAKADAAYEKANEVMKLAIEPLERAYAINPEDKDAKSILNVLKQLYFQFEMMEDYERVKALIEG